MSRKTKTIALSGVLSAVAVILMSLGSLITVLDMSAAFAAGFTVVIAMIELDKTTAAGVYAVSGLLAFVLLPDKYTAVTFLCYGGLYPILKSFCEMIKNKPAAWVLKCALSNVLLTGIIWLGRYFIVAGDDPLGFEIWIYILGNFIFLAYDLALTMIITKYYVMFKHKRN
ncbi:MAG: hypothetical protein PHW77_00845 [Eubacteriales bacterium]|nr:hypothetical protein [Eubacteriales bacterium]